MQPQARERLPVAPRVDPKAAQLSPHEHGLIAHDIAQSRRVFVDEASDPVECRVLSRNGGLDLISTQLTGILVRQAQGFEVAISVKEDAIRVDRM